MENKWNYRNCRLSSEWSDIPLLSLPLLLFLAKKVFKGHCKQPLVSKLLSWPRASTYLILPTELLIYHFNNNPFPLPLPPLPSWFFFQSFVPLLSSLACLDMLVMSDACTWAVLLYPWWWMKSKLLCRDLNFNPFKWCMLYYSGDFFPPILLDHWNLELLKKN